jgi:hypothetical protein
MYFKLFEIFKAKKDLLLKMYEEFKLRLTPDTRTNRFFGQILPEIMIPYFAEQWESKDKKLHFCHNNSSFYGHIKVFHDY